MYDKLDAHKIPNCTVAVDVLIDDLDIALISLVGLATTLPFLLNKQDHRQELAKGLCAHWPDVRQWALFLYRNIIVKEDLEINHRRVCKTAVLEFLGLSRESHLTTWSKSFPTDREVMKIICGLWFLEIRDPRFSSWDSESMVIKQRESAVFDECLIMAFKLGVSIDWENILSVFQGDPKVIARVSLCHLEVEISHREGLDLCCIACDLQVVSALAQREDICIALMHQGMINAASDSLALMVDREWNGDMQAVAALCMINATAILRSRIEEMDALPFLSQALERGLVASLLKCEGLLTCLGQPSARQEPLLLLAEVLPGYSVYRSVLHQLTLAVDAAVRQGLDAKLSGSGGFRKAWKRLKDTVEERRRLVKRDISSGHVQTCQNDMVNNVQSFQAP
ncbi:hypothetical protein JVT61DRAFT_8864 [Boletus reticuloceps]|uniref:Uncharacterized protein n=1 Tax=Boletus reticuloceps TaxID=495285 RepID=A0A8I2YHG7_9AGAM|nr:hypothetical protein JVT61DRAFT_8864 [Boletus reticuloceps]